MTNFTPEMIEKAKTAKSADELVVLAKENGMEMSEAQAKAYYEQLHPASGELSDDELDNVAGGGCYAGDGRLVVSMGYSCFLLKGWVCKKCGNTTHKGKGGTDFYPLYHVCSNCGELADCGHCKNCTYEKGLWLCNNEKYSK